MERRRAQRQRRSTQRRPRTYRTAVGLPEETRQSVVAMLNQSLADTTDLMTQMKFAHWNVKGMNFYQLHLLFDEVAEMLEEHADTIAERATALGGEASGTVRMAAANTRIPEMPANVTTGPEYVEAMVEHLGIHANDLRRDIQVAVERGDDDTADMYTELSREVDEKLYFLEAHLQAGEGRIPGGSGTSMQEGTGTSMQGGPGTTVPEGTDAGMQGGTGTATQEGSGPSMQDGTGPQDRRYGGPRY